MKRILTTLLGLGVAVAANHAEAVPAFARTTGMACSSCHDAWPVLNDFGEAFRDRGYRVRAGTEDGTDHALAAFPIALRTALAYQDTITSHQTTDSGEKTVHSGSLAFPEADVIFGENLSPGTSVFAVISGFGSEGTASLESAWARLNDLGGSSWLNLKIGQTELDLPSSEHRAYTLTREGFLIDHYHPGGSLNGFSIGDNQTAIELSGHGDGPGFRYALSLANSPSEGGAGPFSAPATYLHLTYTTLPDNSFLKRFRIGLVADANWTPTEYLQNAGENVAGTGKKAKMAMQAGLDLHFAFNTLANPVALTLTWLYGKEDKALVPGATDAPAYHGGYAELDYTATVNLQFFGRVESVMNLKQAVSGTDKSAGNQMAVAVGARHILWLSSWGSMAGHVEASSENDTKASALGKDVRTTAAFAGIDLAI